jgi:hypothetical protein
VKGGILKFKDNILDHLRKGLLSWLFGALAEGGIGLPDKFDIKGIIKLLASIFGLTWTNIRNRIIRQIGEKAMAAVEKGVEIFSVLASQGVAGLWQMLIEKLGDIKEMILDQVKDFVITRIITAGITWLISLLNPAAAFIKACKLIYDEWWAITMVASNLITIQSPRSVPARRHGGIRPRRVTICCHTCTRTFARAMASAASRMASASSSARHAVGTDATALNNVAWSPRVAMSVIRVPPSATVAARSVSTRPRSCNGNCRVPTIACDRAPVNPTLSPSIRSIAVPHD